MKTYILKTILVASVLSIVIAGCTRASGTQSNEATAKDTLTASARHDSNQISRDSMGHQHSDTMSQRVR